MQRDARGVIGKDAAGPVRCNHSNSGRYNNCSSWGHLARVCPRRNQASAKPNFTASGERVEPKMLTNGSSSRSAFDIAVPNDEASAPVLFANESEVAVIPAGQQSTQKTGTLQWLIDLGYRD